MTMDWNGMNGVAIVKGNTITVTAVYVVNTNNYSYNQIAEMNKNINSFLNNANYSVSEGDYAGKDVKFNLSFVPDVNENDEWNNSENYNIGGINIGNDFVSKDNSFTYNKFLEDGSSIKRNFGKDNIGGVTLGNRSIAMNRNQDNLRNRIHEIFHTLFFDNDDAMFGIGSYKNLDMPKSFDINRLINNPKLNKINE